MASSRNADVNLIVRARTEGEKAIAGLGDILESLFADAREGSDDLANLGKSLGALDRAAAAIAGSMDKAGSAIDRQRASIAENNAAYSSLLRQQAEAQRVLGSFGDQANKAFVGPRTKAFTEQYEGVRDEVDRLGASISNLFAKIGQQSAQLNGTQSALLNLSSTSQAVAQGQAVAEARIDQTSQALREQAVAAERVSDVQQRINSLTGVNRPDATGSAGRAADILAAADAEFRRLEAVRAAAEAQRALNNELAERASLEAAIERNTGVGGLRATDAGASFSALAERERAAEQTERESQAQRDLAEATRATNSALAERAQIEASIERSTGFGRSRAIDNGASLSALTELVNKEHEAALASEQLDREAAQLRVTLNPLAAIQERFNVALARYKTLAAAGKISTDELAEAEQHLAKEAKRAAEAVENAQKQGDSNTGQLGQLGLRNYELQNLTYQINDVVTGLASGQNLTQIIAQQGGQILQLFPAVAGRLIGALTNPAIAAFVVTVGAIAFGLKEAADQAARLREFAGAVSFRADGASYDAGALASQAEALERIGASAKDADAAINALVDQSVADDAIGGLGRAAQQTAERLGQSLPDAARAAAEAFTGGFDAVAQFDDKLKFLTASEREHIRALFDSGNAEAARTEARLAYQRMEDGIAAKSRGPWADAARSLGNAWDALINFIADSAPIQITISALNALAVAAKGVGDAISDALGDDTPVTAGVAERIGQVQAQIRTLQKTITDYEATIAKGAPGAGAGALQRVVDLSKRQLAEARANLARLERDAPDTVNDGPNSVAAKRRGEELQRISRESELQRLRDAGQARLLTATERARRLDLVGLEAAKNTTDSVVAAALRRQAIANETAKIEKDADARKKEALREQARLAKQTQFIDPVQARVSSGFGPRKSPGGVGSTFHKGVDFAVPVGTSVRAPAAGVVIETGTDAKLGRYVLIDHGNKTQSRLGHLSDNAVVRPGQEVVQGQVVAKSGNTGSATTGPHLHYTVLVNGKPVDPQKGIFVGDGRSRFEADRGEAIQDYEDALEDRAARQDNFNLKLRQEGEERQRIIDALNTEAGLYGTALLAERRRQAVAEAELELRQRTEDANRNLKPGLPPIIVTDAQVVTVKDLAAALFDAQHAREALNAQLADAQRPGDELAAQRDLLREQAEFLRSIGENTQAGAVDEQIRALGGSIRQAYDALIAFYEALSPTQRVDLGIIDQAQLDAVIAKLKQAKQASQDWGKTLGIENASIVQVFASAAASAFTNFINKVSAGKNVFKALAQSVREFAANFISSIAQMIVQLLAFAATVQVMRALGVPIPASFGVGQHHTGGIAGAAAGGVRRTATADVFAGAMRFHRGGIAGFAPDEVPAILKRNEEVLTEGDPRHRFNGGLNAGRGPEAPTSIKIVNTFDREEAAEMLLRTRAGERAILNFISENPRAVKAALS